MSLLGDCCQHRAARPACFQNAGARCPGRAWHGAGSGARCMQVWSSAPAGISSFQRVSVVAAACRCKKKAGNFHHRIMRVNSQTKVKVIRSKKKGNKFWRKKWKLKGSKIHHRRTAWTESEYDGVAVACVVAQDGNGAARPWL